MKSSQSRPLIVEWPSSDRAALEALAKRTLVVVRYQGCEMEVLRSCTVPAKYNYTPLTPRQDRVTVRGADELYANFPIGAAKLEGRLKRSGELNVNMIIVGQWDADKSTVEPRDLQGECKGATHVIAALTAGAFDFYAGASGSVGAGVSVVGVGAGAESSSARESLVRDGTIAACEKASKADKEPPEGCGAFIRVEVAELGRERLDTAKPTLELGLRKVGALELEPLAAVDVARVSFKREILEDKLSAEARASWKNLFEAIAATKVLQAARARRERDRNECLRRLCPEQGSLERQLREDGRKVENAQASVRRSRQLAIRALRASTKRQGSHATGAELLAFAYLNDEEARDKPFNEATWADNLKEPVDLYRRAEAASTNDVVVKSWAGYYLAHALWDALRLDEGVEVGNRLVDGGLGSISTEWAWRLGDYQLDVKKDPEAALKLYRRGLAGLDAKDILRALILYKTQWAAMRASRWKESFDAGILLLEDTMQRRAETGDPGTDFVAEGVLLASLCVDRLGGIEKEPLRTASSQVLAFIGMGIARDALQRSDILGAARAWEMVASRAPATLEAASALAGRGAVYERMGDERRAKETRDLLAANYSMSSPWAETLRKSRDKFGHPSDEAIREAISGTPPELPKTAVSEQDRLRDARRRVSRLLQHCSSFLPKDVVASDHGRFELFATVIEGKPARIKAQLDPPSSRKKAAATCVEEDGPGYFAGAANSVHASVELLKPVEELTGALISNTLASEMASLRERCWDLPQAAKSTNAPERATVIVNLQIDSGGNVSQVSASGGEGYPSLAPCVATHFEALAFPASRSPARNWRVPVAFGPK